MNSLSSQLLSVFRPIGDALSAEETTQVQLHRLLTLLGLGIIPLFSRLYDISAPGVVNPEWPGFGIVALLTALLTLSYTSPSLRKYYVECMQGILYIAMAWISVVAAVNGFTGNYDMGVLVSYAVFAAVVGLAARTIRPLLWFLSFGLVITAIGTVGASVPRSSLDTLLLSMVGVALVELIAVRGYVSIREERAARDARYRAIAESAQNAIVTMDAESTIRFANPAVEEVFGYAPSELVGESLTMLMPERFRQRHQAGVDRFVATGEKTLDWAGVEFIGLRKEGEEIDLSISFSKYEQEGELRFEAVIRNITERKRREEALRRKTTLLEQTQRLAGAWEVDLRTDDVRWSEEVYRIHEVPSGTTVDIEDDIQFYAPEVQGEVREAFQRCVEEREPYDLELPLITEGGDRRWVRTVGAPAETDAGEVVKVAGALQDITDQKEAEQALAETKARYETLIDDVFEGLPGGVFVLNDNFEVVWMNEAIEEFFGIDREEVVGKRKPDLVETTFKHIFEAPKEFAAEALGTYDDNAYPCQFECHVLAGPGRAERWLRHQSRPIQHGQYKGGRVEVYTDITMRKRNERERRRRGRQLEQIRKNVTDVVWMSPPDKSDIEFITEAYEEIWGRSTEHLRDHPDSVVEAIHPDDRERVRSALAEQKQNPDAYAETYRVVQPDGEVRWVRDRAAGVYDERGQLVRIIGVATDITERKRREEAMELRHEKVEALYAATNKLLRAETREEVSTSIQKLLNNVFGYPIAAVRFLDEGELVPVQVSPEISKHMPERPAFDAEGESVVAQVYRKGQTRIFEDLRSAGDPFEYGEVRATAIVPMGEYGTISVADLEVGTIDAYDRHLFEILSTYATLVLDHIDQKKTLREERDLLDQILETSPAAIAVFNREGDFRQASGQAEDVLGLTRDEVTTRTYNDPAWAITAPDGSPMPDEELPFARVMATGEPVHNIEHAIEWPDGTRRLLSVSGAPLHSDDGTLEGAVFHIEDITERKQREHQLSAIIENTANPIFIKDREGRYQFMNEAAASIFGLEPPEVIGKSDADLFDEESAADIRADELQILDNGETLEGERTVYVEGEEVVFLDNKYPYRNEDGHIVGVMGISQDITERKQEARRREQVISRVTDAIVEVDSDWRFTLVNDQAEALYDMREENLLGESFWDVFEGALGTRFEEQYRSVMNSREPTRFEEHYPELNGWFDVQVYPNDDGGVAFYFVEVTERKEREQALVEAKEEAERMNRLKSTFLANMSHEIRTPLTTILGFAEAIGEEISREEKESVHRFSHLIQKSGHRLMETLNGVLNLSKLEAGEMDFSPEPVDLAVELEEALDQFQPKAEEQGVTLQVERQGPVGAWVDSSGVQIVLRNLVSNGIKYTDEGGTVWMRTYAEDETAVLEVEDTGIGMAPGQVEELFESFQQGSTGTSREYEGTGLGLTVTKQAVEEMGGTLDVETEKGVGTRFTVRLAIAGEEQG